MVSGRERMHGVPRLLLLFRYRVGVCVFKDAAAAAAAKSHQPCPTLCNPIEGSPPGYTIHGIVKARVLEWGAIAFSGLH